MLNRVQLIGRLTRDPELRNTQSGKAVCSATIAINKKVGKDQEVVFLDLTVWDKQAEALTKFLKKGELVYVEGSIAQEEWNDKTTGAKRSKLKVVVSRWEFISTVVGQSVGSKSEIPEEDPAF